jgi:hypothetical protein
MCRAGSLFRDHPLFISGEHLGWHQHHLLPQRQRCAPAQARRRGCRRLSLRLMRSSERRARVDGTQRGYASQEGSPRDGSITQDGCRHRVTSYFVSRAHATRFENTAKCAILVAVRLDALPVP